MKVVGYVRVSTEEQVQGFGLKFQQESIEAFCNQQGLDLVRTYRDAGISGSTLDRPALQEMLADLPSFDGIVVYSVCRLSRDRVDTQLIVDRQLWPAGKVLLATTQQVDIRTEEGRLMIALMAGLNQLERIKIIKRTSDGRRTKAAQGGYAGGRPPFGLRKTWILDERGNVIEKKLAPDPHEQAIIDLVRRHHRSGKSNSAIAKYLNHHGYKTKSGKLFSRVQVAKILTCPNRPGVRSCSK